MLPALPWPAPWCAMPRAARWARPTPPASSYCRAMRPAAFTWRPRLSRRRMQRSPRNTTLRLAPASVAEQVTVTAYRAPLGDLESPAITRQLSSETLQTTAAVSLDGKMRPASRRRALPPLQFSGRQSDIAGHQPARPRIHLRQPHAGDRGRRSPQRSHRRLDSLGRTARARHPFR